MTARLILRRLAAGLGVKEAELVALVDDPNAMLEGETSNADMRLFKYANRGSEDEDDWGEAHADIGLLTMIPLGGAGNQIAMESAPGKARFKSPAGLKMLDKARGLWVSIEESAQPGDMVVFPSDVFRVLFGGLLGGTVHRVHRPKKSAAGGERFSIPLIVRPKDRMMIRTIPHGPMAQAMAETAMASDPKPKSFLFPSYSPHYRMSALAHVIPSARDFAYLPDDADTAAERALLHRAGKHVR